MAKSLFYLKPQNMLEWKTSNSLDTSLVNPIGDKHIYYQTTTTSGVKYFNIYLSPSMFLNQQYLGTQAYVISADLYISDTYYASKSWISINECKIEPYYNTSSLTQTLTPILVFSVKVSDFPDITSTYVNATIKFRYTYDTDYQLNVGGYKGSIYEQSFNVQLGANVVNPYNPVN